MTVHPGPMVDLGSYDVILVNTSAGKDSQSMLDVVVNDADVFGVRDRIVAVHADLGRVEWPGTPELAAEHAAHYGVRFVKVSRPQGDLLDMVEARGMWPSSTARYCTSDLKRGQVRKVMTMLAREHHDAGLGRPVRFLSCMGFRREESSARAKKVPFRYDQPASGKGTVRHVDEWCPILEWTVADVWERIRLAGTRPHPAYAAGMPWLSCCFCVLAGRAALVRAAQLMPDLAQTYLATEVRIGHRFKNDLSMAEIIEAANREHVLAIPDWNA